MIHLFRNASFAAALSLIISVSVIGQTSSEYVKTGFTNYQNGEYNEAVKSFDQALKNYSSDQSGKLTTEKREVYVSESSATDVSTSKREYTETSNKNYTGRSKRELIQTETKKYQSTPLEYQGDEPAKIYLYRGRTYLQMENKEAALNDFDKAVSLDPTLSEVYFRRALANMEVDPDKACPDLEAAIKRGHNSAKELFDLICAEE